MINAPQKPETSTTGNQQPSDAAPKSGAPPAHVLALIRKKRAELAAESEARRAERAAQSAREARAKYAQEKRAAGKTVRKYTFHDHESPGYPECQQDRERRMHRNRQRIYRGADERLVRDYTDLSHLSPEEKAEYKRTENRKRKRAQRERERQKPASEEMALIDGLLADLDL